MHLLIPPFNSLSFFFFFKPSSSSRGNPTQNGHSSQRLTLFHNDGSCTLYSWLSWEMGWLPIIYEDKETLTHTSVPCCFQLSGNKRVTMSLGKNKWCALISTVKPSILRHSVQEVTFYLNTESETWYHSILSSVTQIRDWQTMVYESNLPLYLFLFSHELRRVLQVNICNQYDEREC